MSMLHAIKGYWLKHQFNDMKILKAAFNTEQRGLPSSQMRKFCQHTRFNSYCGIDFYIKVHSQTQIDV